MIPKPRDSVSSAHLNDLEHEVSSSDLLEALTDAVLLVDTHGVIRFATPAASALTGFEGEELVGMTVEALIPQNLRSAHVSKRTGFTREATPRPMGASVPTVLVHSEGYEIPVDIGLGLLSMGSERWTLAAIRDFTSQKSVEQGRLDIERRFRLAFEENMAPMIFTNLHDQIIAANDAFYDMIGYSSDDVLGEDSVVFTHPEDVGISEKVHRTMTIGQANQVRYQKRYVHKEGRTIYVEVSKSIARDGEGNDLYYVISERDISDRVQRDRVLQLRSDVNRLAMHASSEADFLQRVCDIMADDGGYALAWVGVAPRNRSDAIEIVCSSGVTDYLYGDVVSWWGSEKSGPGPTETALRTGVSQVVNDLVKEASHEPWRERALQFGFGSSVAISQRMGTRAGVIVIYSRSVHAFDELTVKGLEEIALEVEFAVAHVQTVQMTERALTETTNTIQALNETELARAESEQRFRLAFENNMAPMVFTDVNDAAIAVNEAFCEMVGFTREELLGHDSRQFTYPEDIGITEETHQQFLDDEVDQLRYVKRYLRKDGGTVISEVSRSVARDASGEALYFVFSERDVTEERALTAQLSHQALHDPLTGLANRALFEDRLAQAHSRMVRGGGLGAVLLLDLDDFKGVNDTYGHVIGDQLLAAIAARLESVTRSSDTLCRFGGDEFLYLAEGLTSATQAEEVANRLLGVLAERFSFGGYQMEQRASVGMVICDGMSEEHLDWVKEADVALYEAKRMNRGRHVVFDPSMHETAINRFSLVQELRHALDVGDLSMYYQPIVDLVTTEIVGFESLMRWYHPDRGTIPPSVFIPLAEQSDLILELGAFAMREAVEAASHWRPANSQAPRPFVTVNLSAHQFRGPSLLTMIEAALASSGLAVSRLIIEVTESVAFLAWIHREKAGLKG